LRLTILSVGRWKAGAMRDLFDDYAGRLTPALVLREIEIRRRTAPDELRRLEGAALVEALPKGAVAVVLDGRGAVLSSEGLAEKMRGWRDSGRGDVVFLIGGADGHDAAVLARADATISLGAMTWPHLLVRVMLAEQVYRAQQILAGHPYHRA
jgi:23S rRNA (pseudouridine1915-N3)-methyltransferase